SRARILSTDRHPSNPSPSRRPRCMLRRMSRPARTRGVLAAGIPVALVTAVSILGSWVAGEPAAGAATAAGSRKVIVVLVDRMSAATMAAVGGAQQLDALGASGLMVTATGPGP